MLKNHKDDFKSDFRRSCLKRLEFASRVTKRKKNKIVVDILTKLIDELEPKSILLYLPLETEVDVRPLIKSLRRRKRYSIYVPYMKGDSFVPVKYRLPLYKKRFGIKEPKFSNITEKIDLAIVPIVGIDDIYKRIGFGKGMYDRFFGRINYRPTTIFTALTLCKSNMLLSSKHDIRADYIITA